MNILLKLYSVLFCISLISSAQENTYRFNSTETTSLKKRINTLVYAHNYEVMSGNTDANAGVRAWPTLLCKLYKVKSDTAKLKAVIASDGNNVFFSHWAGNLCKPFSVPGMLSYYFNYKEFLPPNQKNRLHEMLYEKPILCEDSTVMLGWDYLMREDGKMDVIYENTEFNSENYNWMARMGGYLLAEHFKDIKKLPYFSNHLNNWIRALYNSGRVEWNSNNYWGHTFIPTMVLHDHATSPKVKKQATAGLDWLLTESAIHYIDGFQAAGDVRAKNSCFLPFSGSIWGFSYFYFTDSLHTPTYVKSLKRVKDEKLKDFVGYPPYSDYTPPKVIVDIAQRKFPMPVEIQSAKPYYLLDNDNYSDWKGNTDRSRKFEFETVWLDSNCIMASLASNRPDGSFKHKEGKRKQEPFSEENLWRLAVKGSNYGAIQVTGNSGKNDNVAGRCPEEEIGQFQNVMIRLVKDVDNSWVLIPNEAIGEQKDGILFVNFNCGVFAAWQCNTKNTITSEPFKYDRSHLKYTWQINPNELSGLILEVGTQRTYASFEKFKEAILSKSKIKTLDENTVQYISASGNNISITYNPRVTYTTRLGYKIENAGVTPSLVGNGKSINYGTWDSYHVSYGFPIVEQKWGSGVLNLKSKFNQLSISIDPETSDVSWKAQ